VTNRLLGELESFYDKGRPKVTLLPDELGKLHWRNKRTGARVPQSLNDLSLNEIEEESEHLSISRESSLQASEKNDGMVGSLVSMITVDIPDTFKKIFLKGKSMKDVKGKNVRSTQELDMSLESKLTRASTLNPKSFRVLSIPELDLHRSERKQLNESFEFKESPQCLQMLTVQTPSASTPSQFEGFRMSLNRPSLPQREDAHSQLHLNIKNSANDRLSHKALDSPMLKSNPLKIPTMNHQSHFQFKQ